MHDKKIGPATTLILLATAALGLAPPAAKVAAAPDVYGDIAFTALRLTLKFVKPNR
ncbi:MAG TPA: hypothetical protein VIN61_07195 [Gammaproteobacteria bacterium]